LDRLRGAPIVSPSGPGCQRYSVDYLGLLARFGLRCAPARKLLILDGLWVEVHGSNDIELTETSALSGEAGGGEWNRTIDLRVMSPSL
jgi:hypothetical protein